MNRRHRTRLVGLVTMLGALWSLAIIAAPPADADAAGPTDYRTDIVSIEPATDAFTVEMIGGDSFMRLVQLEPVEIVVVGYRNEPYLRFESDGTVVENRRSPSTWLNEERYGTDDELPDFVDPQAPPQWHVVATDGAYSWHDHRSHWMNPNRPPGATAGDQVLEAVVPLEVAGERISITVASFLLDDPSPVAPLVGGIVGSGLAAAGLTADRRRAGGIGAVVAGIALVFGFIAYRSVPPETAPSSWLWLLPLIATLACIGLVSLRQRLATTVYLDGLAVAAGVALVAWSFSRVDALRRALIPSDVPAPADRAVIVAGVIMGLLLVFKGGRGLLRPQMLRELT